MLTALILFFPDFPESAYGGHFGGDTWESVLECWDNPSGLYISFHRGELVYGMGRAIIRFRLSSGLWNSICSTVKEVQLGHR